MEKTFIGPEIIGCQAEIEKADKTLTQGTIVYYIPAGIRSIDHLNKSPIDLYDNVEQLDWDRFINLFSTEPSGIVKHDRVLVYFGESDQLLLLPLEPEYLRLVLPSPEVMRMVGEATKQRLDQARQQKQIKSFLHNATMAMIQRAGKSPDHDTVKLNVERWVLPGTTLPYPKHIVEQGLEVLEKKGYHINREKMRVGWFVKSDLKANKPAEDYALQFFTEPVISFISTFYQEFEVNDARQHQIGAGADGSSFEIADLIEAFRHFGFSVQVLQPLEIVVSWTQQNFNSPIVMAAVFTYRILRDLQHEMKSAHEYYYCWEIMSADLSHRDATETVRKVMATMLGELIPGYTFNVNCRKNMNYKHLEVTWA